MTTAFIATHTLESHTSERQEVYIHHASRVLSVNGDIIKLTPTEYQIICCLLNNPTVKDETLATCAGNHGPFTTAVKESLERHIVNLRSKLWGNDLNIFRIRGHGYMLVVNPNIILAKIQHYPGEQAVPE